MISGPGANVLSAHGYNAYTVFDMADFAAVTSNVTISGLTITGGSASVSSGGGIINRENLTVLRHKSRSPAFSAWEPGG